MGEDIPVGEIFERVYVLRFREDPKALAYGLCNYHIECNLKVDHKTVATAWTKTRTYTVTYDKEAGKVTFVSPDNAYHQTGLPPDTDYYLVFKAIYEGQLEKTHVHRRGR